MGESEGALLRSFFLSKGKTTLLGPNMHWAADLLLNGKGSKRKEKKKLL